MQSPVDSVDAPRSSGSTGQAGDGANLRPAALHCLMCGGEEHRVVFTERRYRHTAM